MFRQPCSEPCDRVVLNATLDYNWTHRNAFFVCSLRRRRALWVHPLARLFQSDDELNSILTCLICSAENLPMQAIVTKKELDERTNISNIPAETHLHQMREFWKNAPDVEFFSSPVAQRQQGVGDEKITQNVTQSLQHRLKRQRQTCLVKPQASKIMRRVALAATPTSSEPSRLFPGPASTVPSTKCTRFLLIPDSKL